MVSRLSQNGFIRRIFGRFFAAASVTDGAQPEAPGREAAPE
jgi:hypothetical protein